MNDESLPEGPETEPSVSPIGGGLEGEGGEGRRFASGNDQYGNPIKLYYSQRMRLADARGAGEAEVVGLLEQIGRLNFAAVAERSEGSPVAPSFEGEREAKVSTDEGIPDSEFIGGALGATLNDESGEREGEPCENCSGTGGGPDAALTCVACGGSGWVSGEREGATPRCTCGRNVEGDWHRQDCPLSVREGATPDEHQWAKYVDDLQLALSAIHNDTDDEAIAACANDALAAPDPEERGVALPLEQLPEGVARTAPSPVLYDELREAVVTQLEKLRPDRKLRKSGAYWDGYDDALDDAIDVAEGNPTVGQVVALSERERPCSPAPIPKEDE